jgi:hypothetical protein
MEPVALVGTRYSELNTHPREGAASVSYHFATERETTLLLAPAPKRLTGVGREHGGGGGGGDEYTSDPFKMLGLSSSTGGEQAKLPGVRPTLHRVVINGKIRMVADDGSFV